MNAGLFGLRQIAIKNMNIIQQTVDEILKNEILEYYYGSKTQYKLSSLQYLKERLRRYGDCSLILISDQPIQQSCSTSEKVLYFSTSKEYVYICIMQHLFKNPPELGKNIQCSLRTQHYKLYNY